MAEFIFDFVEDDSTVPATLTLSGFTSRSTDTTEAAELATIQSLEFSPQGQARFGFGPIYDGTFDHVSTFTISDTRSVVDRFALDDNGLMGISDHQSRVISVTDFNPPETALTEFEGDHFLVLIATDHTDAIRLGFRAGFQITYVDGVGRWVLVPEPRHTGMNVLYFTVLLGAWRKQLRVRQCDSKR